MFNRVAYENWHNVVPFIAFGTTALVFLTMSIRALLLRKDKAEKMSHLPLDD
jgi:FtsH-binding integral membrane protein